MKLETKPVNSGESSLSVEADSPSLSEGIDPALPRDTALASLETAVI